MFCRNCGNPLNNNELKCSVCGSDNSKKETNTSLIIVIALIFILIIIAIYLISNIISKISNEFTTEFNYMPSTIPIKTEEIQVKTLNISIFYDSNDESANELISYLESLDAQNPTYILNIMKYDIYENEENVYILEKFISTYNYNQTNLPIYTIGKQIISGYTPTYDENYIVRLIAKAYNDTTTYSSEIDIVAPILKAIEDEKKQ